MINNSQVALIDLDSMDDIKDFANLVVTYDSDINIYRGSNMYDAIGIIVAIILAIITTIYTISLTHIHKEQYIIKIHDDASYNEFTIKYRIIQKQGNVYTVEEKEDK